MTLSLPEIDRDAGGRAVEPHGPRCDCVGRVPDPARGRPDCQSPHRVDAQGLPGLAVCGGDGSGPSRPRYDPVHDPHRSSAAGGESVPLCPGAAGEPGLIAVGEAAAFSWSTTSTGTADPFAEGLEEVRRRLETDGWTQDATVPACYAKPDPTPPVGAGLDGWETDGGTCG